MAKKISVMATLAAVKRGFLKKRSRASGGRLCSSQAMKAASRTSADAEAGEDGRLGPALRRAPR